MTPEYKSEALALVLRLDVEVHALYWRMFALGTGGQFHAFVEWCGVMREHLKIVEGLLKADVDAFNMNTHTGQALPIPQHQLSYLAEKMECIFHGAIEVRVADREPLQLPPMPGARR